MGSLPGRVIVQKYGGSSVGDVCRLRQVAERIHRSALQGDRLVVVVSAMGNTTNELLSLARRMSSAPPRRELDMLVSVGERISMALLSMAINDLGTPAISFTGSQSGIITDDRHTSARVLEVRPGRILEALDEGKVAIVAGFQGMSRHREVTTLGRGGSDTTAVALAAALDADSCEICSDVDGVFSADPRRVPEARRLHALSYDEALALLRGGARVLHPEAVAFARRHGIVLRAVSTSGSEGGTTIGPQRPGPTGRVVAVTVDRDVMMVTVPDEDAPDLWDCLEQNAVPTRLLRGSMALVETRDLHGEQSIRWPRRASLADVAAATAAGLGAGRPSLLRAGDLALRETGAEILAAEADADRLIWILRGEGAGAEALLHRSLVLAPQ